MITYKLFEQYNEIAHFCTDRSGGVSMGNYASCNMSPYSGDNPEDYNTNRSILCRQLGIEPDKFIIPYQIHGTDILEIDASFLQQSEEDKTNSLHGMDAIYTQLPGVCIGVTTADCVPLLFFDPHKQVIAAAHAGWKGTCGRIAEKTVQSLVDKFNCQPTDILVAIGPSISSNVYEVGKEVVDQFENAGFDIPTIVTTSPTTYYLDLWKANQLSLEKAGVLSNHIEISGICTYTQHEQFFSARRLGIKSGRMLSGIMLIS